MVKIRLPQINAPTPQGQMAQMKSYLFQLAEQLQWALNVEGGETRTASTATPTQEQRAHNIVVEEALRNGTVSGVTVQWRYRKWLNGVLECWCKHEMKVTISTQTGGLYYGAVPSFTYPLVFVDAPACHFSLEHSNGTKPLYLTSNGTGSESTTPPISICGAEAQTATCTISVYAYGRWK